MPSLTLVRGSVTDQSVDAIVNAANTLMRGGGGIDGRIHALAGPRMLNQLRRVAPRGSEVGEAVVTPGFELPQQWVIHVAGPIWRGGDQDEPALLAASYRNALVAAEKLGCASIAFPSISTGAFGFPLELAARIAVETLAMTPSSVAEIVLSMWGSAEHDAFQQAMSMLDVSNGH